MAATKTITTTDLANALDTDPRTLRKFLRSSASPVDSVGKGKRYALPANATALKQFGKAFAAWKAVQAERAAEREATENAPDTRTDDAETELQGELDEHADEMNETDGPTDDELEDITAELDDEN